MAIFEFMSSDGNRVSIHTDQIASVARPKGSFPGELRLYNGSKWGFGGDNRQSEYKRALAALEADHEARREKDDDPSQRRYL